MSTIWEERYGHLYKEFIEGIKEWEPDFIVPVARKSCKLFASMKSLFEDLENRIFYREHFAFITKADLSNKRIAIVDDAVRRTGNLRAYREDFLKMGVPEEHIGTYGFIGHRQLLDDPSRKCDKNAMIFHFMSPAAYEEYLIHQSDHLILTGANQDIAHLVLETEVFDISNSEIEKLWGFLAEWGYRYQLESIEGIKRFGIHAPSFLSIESVISKLNLPLMKDIAGKMRFTFWEKERFLLCSPLISPQIFVSNNDFCKLGLPAGVELPIILPCEYRGSHHIDKFCYLSICLLLDALLARMFLLALRDSLPELYSFFENIKVRRWDWVRYLGQDIGNSMSVQIEEFIRGKSSESDCFETSHGAVWSELLVSPFPFSRKNVPAVLQHLRNGYENALRENNDDPVGVKYAKPLNYLLEIDGGIHPLMFTEVIDELCDFGVLVPETEYMEEERCWRRVYRTGEDPHATLPWECSRRIVPLAIQTLDADGVKRMYLEKTLANFVYDFPAYAEEAYKDYPELHCLITRASYWGPQVFVTEPMGHKTIPLSPERLKGDGLAAWKEFATFFDFERKVKKFVSRSPLTDISEFLDPRLVRDYFRFMAQLKRESGRVDALNALVLCRSKDWFYLHLMHNMDKWRGRGSYRDFLDDLQHCKTDRIHKQHLEHLNHAGKMAHSARQKVDCANEFPSTLERCRQIADRDPVSFRDVWDFIEANTAEQDHPFVEEPSIACALHIIGAMQALDGLTRLKLDIVKPSKRAKTEEKVLTMGPQEFRAIGIDVDIRTFLEKEHNYQEVYNFLFPIYRQVIRAIGSLPEPKSQEDFIAARERSDARRWADFYNALVPRDERAEKESIQKAFDVAKTELGFVFPELIMMKKDDIMLVATFKDEYEQEAHIGVDLKTRGILRIERLSGKR